MDLLIAILKNVRDYDPEAQALRRRINTHTYRYGVERKIQSPLNSLISSLNCSVNASQGFSKHYACDAAAEIARTVNELDGQPRQSNDGFARVLHMLKSLS